MSIYISIEKTYFTYCVKPTSSPFSNFLGLVHVEQLSGSIMMPKEAQFTEFLAGVANFPIHFVLGILGAHNKRHNNPQHVIITSVSGSDLERAVNSK